MDERDEPETIDVARDEAVTITYRDGHVARFPIEDLRRACPCATCRELRSGPRQEAWPLPNSPQPLRIEDASLHGAWGLNLKWNDGHATGIYPFESLRRWNEGGPSVAPDSGLDR